MQKGRARRRRSGRSRGAPRRTGLARQGAAEQTAGAPLASATGRWVVLAGVLGSGAVFLEATAVNVALPAIGRDFGLGIEGVQWIVNGYLLSLSALMLLGGALGDAHSRRRVFMAGLLGFAVTSVLSAAAPNAAFLVGCRILQGACGALLVPNSLALVDTSMREQDRGAAIGRWAGWSAISTAGGPLLGGWLVDSLGWRWVFLIAVPFAAAAAWIAARKIPEPTRAAASGPLDWIGALFAALGLAGIVFALVSGPRLGWRSPGILAAGLGGLAALAAFVIHERRAANPLLPLNLFRSRQFTGANLMTLFVYAALGGLFLFLVLQLQNVLGYSALAAGAALTPVNVLMLFGSPLAGRLGQRFGPRWPMTAGAVLAAAGMLLLARVDSGAGYLTTIVPALLVFGTGLALLVAPLTAAVLGAVDSRQAGVASAVNNAVARLAALLATAILPLAAGIGGLAELDAAALARAFTHVMRINAGLCIAGAAAAFFTIRRSAAVRPIRHPSLSHACTPCPSAGKN